MDETLILIIETTGFNVFIGYLMWASGYAGMLWNNARKNHWKSPPIEECTAMNLV